MASINTVVSLDHDLTKSLTDLYENCKDENDFIQANKNIFNKFSEIINTTGLQTQQVLSLTNENLEKINHLQLEAFSAFCHSLPVTTWNSMQQILMPFEKQLNTQFRAVRVALVALEDLKQKCSQLPVISPEVQAIIAKIDCYITHYEELDDQLSIGLEEIQKFSYAATKFTSVKDENLMTLCPDITLLVRSVSKGVESLDNRLLASYQKLNRGLKVIRAQVHYHGKQYWQYTSTLPKDEIARNEKIDFLLLNRFKLQFEAFLRQLSAFQEQWESLIQDRTNMEKLLVMVDRMFGETAQQDEKQVAARDILQLFYNEQKLQWQSLIESTSQFSNIKNTIEGLKYLCHENLAYIKDLENDKRKLSVATPPRLAQIAGQAPQHLRNVHSRTKRQLMFFTPQEDPGHSINADNIIVVDFERPAKKVAQSSS